MLSNQTNLQFMYNLTTNREREKQDARLEKFNQ